MLEGFGAVGGGDVGGVEEVFCSPWDAVEGASVVASGDFSVGGFGLCECVVAGEGDDAVDLGIELLDALEVDVSEAGAGEFAGLDPAGELVDGGEGDGFVGGGERGVEFGADELVFCGGREWCRGERSPSATMVRWWWGMSTLRGPMRRS